MEHEEEEAVKILEKAEELFKAHDFHGAAVLARKARCLFPSLPGVVNVLVAYHIHLSARAARKAPSGDTDWHAVLGVPPSSDSKMIKKQYMNLRNFTHPDNCKSAAAEGAFELVKKAWRCINSSSPATAASIPNFETCNTTSRSCSPQPPTRSGDAKVKPATKNSDGRSVQAEIGFKTAVHNSKPPENKFDSSSSREQQENGLPPRHTPTSPPMQYSSQSSIPNFLLCPFCGTRNSYRVIEGLCHITCHQCRVTCSIRKDDAFLNKSDQVSDAPPPGSPTGITIVMCRKCRTPYDGEIPNNRRILRKCKLCGSWASIKLEIKQIRVHEVQQLTPAADPPNQTTFVVPGSGDEPSDLPTARELVRCPPSGGACNYVGKENEL